MNQSLTELMDDILTQINEQFEEAVTKVSQRLAELAKNTDEVADSPKPSTGDA